MDSAGNAVELGCTVCDTVGSYGEGHSETCLVNLLCDPVDKTLYTASKIPPMNFKWPGTNANTLKEVFPYQHMIDYTNRTLQNLGTDHVDLIQLHVWDDSWTSDEDWQRAVRDLRQQGKIRAVGISLNRCDPANTLKALPTGLVDAVQVIYNIFDQNPEDELFPVCRELNV